MLSTEEAISKILANRRELQQKSEEGFKKSQEIETILEFFTGALEELQIELKNKNIKVINFPDIQKIKGTVSLEGIASVLLGLDRLLEAVKSQKVVFPDIQMVEGKVKVENQVTIPEVKIPEYPKQIKAEVSSMPKYVQDELKNVVKSLKVLQDTLKSIDFKPKVDVNTTPEIKIDLNGLQSQLEALLEAIQSINVSPTIQIDIDEVKSAVERTTEAIKNIRFPVPNLKSSWDHSFEMQSKDLPATYAYTTVAGKKVIDYIEVQALDGKTYRKTFTYDTDGTTDIVAKSGWIEQ